METKHLKSTFFPPCVRLPGRIQVILKMQNLQHKHNYLHEYEHSSSPGSQTAQRDEL